MWGSIIAGLLKLANAIAAALQQHHDELNGAIQQREADHAETINTLEAVLGPRSVGDTNRLWDTNKARFGTGTGPAEQCADGLYSASDSRLDRSNSLDATI